MKFFRDKTLKQLGAYLLFLMLLIFTGQYLVIRDRISSLEETEEKKDFARSSQLSSQQLSLQVQRFLGGQRDLAPDITSRVDTQDHLLALLRDGGRIDGTTIFIKPLSTLPRITFDRLNQTWAQYKSTIPVLFTENEFILRDEDSTDTTVVDFLNGVGERNAVYDRALLTHEAASLSIANWYERLIKDLNEEALEKESSIRSWFLFFAVIDVALLGLLYFLFDRFVIRPVRTIRLNAEKLEQRHDLPPHELGKLEEEINIIIEHLKDATTFVASIGEGNLEMDYKTLDANYESGKNALADSLIAMQAKLKSMNEEERKRQWANEGLTRFVDILRSSDDNIAILSDKIIAALVKYTNSNQGSLYILNDDDHTHPFLELISLFAFDTKKFEKRQLKLGEGILGQTFLERETTYLTEVPDDYIKITSGLGDSNPRSVLMVPLKLDQQVYGIVELASFSAYSAHEIAFVERLGETIAATLASVKGAQKNRHLIEQFQQQTEEMRAQEEEMRQNMEELTATQEEMARKERDYIERIRALEEEASNGHEPVDLSEWISREQQLKTRIEDLEKQLAAKPQRSDDWMAAEELEKALKINLEALKITREEFDRKGAKN